jgi:hypothetical protein
MSPMTPVQLTLSLQDVEVILQTMLKAAVPGEFWMNTFFNVKKQRDDFIAMLNSAPAAAPAPPAAPPADPPEA